MAKKRKKLCFIIMPFKPILKKVYLKAIKPACENAGFAPERLDEEKGPSNITREIVEKIFDSTVMIADMSGWNPNVFYEMGVAHTIANKTILVIHENDDLPFDVRTYRCIQYKRTEPGLEALKNNLIDALNNFAEWSQKPNNPVQDFKPYPIPGTRLRREQNPAREKIAALERELKSVKSALTRRLRFEPLDELSAEEAQKMVKYCNFFHYAWNRDGKGSYHQYKIIERNGKRLISDETTGLVWQESGSLEAGSFDHANKHIDRLNNAGYGGYNDWRLPTLEEAMSLMERELQNGGLFINSIFHSEQQILWTADKTGTHDVWIVNLLQGWCDHQYDNNNCYVRAVRHSKNAAK